MGLTIDNLLKGMDIFSRDVTFFQNWFVCFMERVYYKRKEFANLGANSFLLKQTHLRWVLISRKAYRKSQTFFPSAEMAEKFNKSNQCP